MSVTYRLAQLEDVGALLQLRLAYLTDHFGALSEDQRATIVHSLPPYLEAHLGHDLSIHVACDDDTIVSCAWLLLVEKPPSPRFPHGRTGILFNVYTAPTHRRRGLANSVMQRLLAKAHDLKLDVVELNATDEGYPLYRSLGFDDDSSTHKPMRMML